MKSSARQESGNERPVRGDAAAASPAPPLRVVDDLPVPLPIADTELEVIERHLHGMLDRVLSDEDREGKSGRDAGGVLRPRLHRTPG
jgi:hypothetical protein